MVLSSSAKIWKDIEGFDSQKQKDILEWQLQAREPIRRFADIRLGDHLVTKRSMPGSFKYEHHFLCIAFDNNGQPKIIHYYNTESNLARFFYTLGGGSGKSLGKMGMI